MRRAGYNPTHNEVLDIINRLSLSPHIDHIQLGILATIQFFQ